jgi:hypothetical protein
MFFIASEAGSRKIYRDRTENSSKAIALKAPVLMLSKQFAGRGSGATKTDMGKIGSCIYCNFSVCAYYSGLSAYP